jgi:hypothetical protein
MLQSNYGMSQGKDRRNGSFQLSLGTSIWIKKTNASQEDFQASHDKDRSKEQNSRPQG